MKSEKTALMIRQSIFTVTNTRDDEMSETEEEK